jgi:hypothetical protein
MEDDPATAPDSGRDEASEDTEVRPDEADEGTTDAADVANETERAPTAPAKPDAADVDTGDAVGAAAAVGVDAETAGSDDVVGEDGSAGSRDESERGGAEAPPDVPEDVRKYARFKKMDGAQYDRVNEFLRDRTYITAREWAIARLCADFRTETGVEMTKIGKNLPRLVPFMTDTYTPQAVNQARASFENKVTKAGATFLYGAMSGFFTAEELDEMMYEVTEIAKFLLEVEGVDLAVSEELQAEERISSVMREVRRSSAELRAEEVECPNCGHTHEV